ncbi:hypothetical protein PENTCL1PPCAC_5589, partial [Pristionchus entomophagus]
EDWNVIRGQIVVYVLLSIIMVSYFAHVDFIENMTVIDTIPGGRHIHCCCQEFKKLNEIESHESQLILSPFVKTFFILILHVLGALSPLWERFICRKKMLMGLMIVGIPASVIVIFSHHDPIREEMSGFLLNLSSLMMITFSTLSEMLPYEMRFLAPYSFIFAASISSTAAALHFRIDFNTTNLGVCCVVFNVLGLILVRFFVKDDLPHEYSKLC